jgi:hypothetical protein
MKKYYRLTKNGTVVDDYEDCFRAQARAALMELHGLSWKALDEDSWFAKGHGDIVTRNEYEIVPIKKRA